MNRLLVASLIIFSLIGCQSNNAVFTVADDPRMNMAVDMERSGQLHNAYMQLKIMSIRFPDNQEIQEKKSQIAEDIKRRKIELENKLNRLNRNGFEFEDQRRNLALKILALTPNDNQYIELLRSKTNKVALERVDKKSRQVIEYFEKSQKKANESIRLANKQETISKLEQRGKKLLSQKQYSELLNVADELEKISPEHISIETYRYNAYYLLSVEAEKVGNYKGAVSYLEKASLNTKELAKQDKIHKKISKIKTTHSNNFYEQGLRALKYDLSEAIAYFTRALELDNSHHQAKQKLKIAETMAENLRKIQND